MYSFAQRLDTRVLDEPLFGHFLSHTGAQRPSRQEVLATMPTDRQMALSSLTPIESDDILFLKHMANHIEGLNWLDVDAPSHRHVILTRHPDAVLSSYRAHIDRPTMLDVGYAHQMRILQEAGDRAVVVTAEALFEDPMVTLQALCKALDVPWDPVMLRWDKGGRPEDGVWAKYWYHSVHNSRGWQPRKLSHHPAPVELRELRSVHGALPRPRLQSNPILNMANSTNLILAMLARGAGSMGLSNAKMPKSASWIA